MAVTTVMAPTGQSPHFLAFRVWSQYPQLLPGEEVVVPTLAIEVTLLVTSTTHMWPLGGAQSFAFYGSGVLLEVSVPASRRLGCLVVIRPFLPPGTAFWRLVEPEKAAAVGEDG